MALNCRQLNEMGSVVMKVLGRINVSVLVAFLTICMCYGEAWGVFDKATALSHFAKGVSYQEKGQWDKAIAEYNKAIELNPKDAHAYYFRRIVYMVHLGNNKKACSDWKRACELGSCTNYDRAKKKVIASKHSGH